MTKTRLLVSLILISLQACQTTGQENNPCGFFKPIYLDKADKLTPDTARQILNHDTIGRDICGWNYV